MDSAAAFPRRRRKFLSAADVEDFILGEPPSLMDCGYFEDFSKLEDTKITLFNSKDSILGEPPSIKDTCKYSRRRKYGRFQEYLSASLMDSAAAFPRRRRKFLSAADVAAATAAEEAKLGGTKITLLNLKDFIVGEPPSLMDRGYFYRYWCVQLLYLLPKNYDFFRDDICQIWDAELYITHGRSSEWVFDEFEEERIFKFSRLHYSTGNPLYQLDDDVVTLLDQLHLDPEAHMYRRIEEDQESHISSRDRYLSIRDSIFLTTINHVSDTASNFITTLLILHDRVSRIDQLPLNFFFKLPCLVAIDLSRTNITELPSSIHNSTRLKYLNLSWTPITTLPDSFCSLKFMQTLKLKGCSKLTGLPEGMSKLVHLQHLDVDVACLVLSMPLRLGNLLHLKTLPAFAVGKEDGCHITELKNMNELAGTLRILRLENVSSMEEARDAALDQKRYIDRLDLHWSDLQQDGLGHLENLQPHANIKELQIMGYGGTEFPSWIGEPRYTKLTTITIHDCKNSQLLPTLGKLHYLKVVNISDMNQVKTIDHQFLGRDMSTESLDLQRLQLERDQELFYISKLPKAFLRLENLAFNGMPTLEKWSGLIKGDFPLLQKLYISDCSKLVVLPGLSIFVSLQHLEISLCPLLESFPDKGLPITLQYVVIIECPLLKEWIIDEEKQDKGKLAHVPNVWVDYQQISLV